MPKKTPPGTGGISDIGGGGFVPVGGFSLVAPTGFAGIGGRFTNLQSGVLQRNFQEMEQRPTLKSVTDTALFDLTTDYQTVTATSASLPPLTRSLVTVSMGFRCIQGAKADGQMLITYPDGAQSVQPAKLRASCGTTNNLFIPCSQAWIPDRKAVGKHLFEFQAKQTRASSLSSADAEQVTLAILAL